MSMLVVHHYLTGERLAFRLGPSSTILLSGATGEAAPVSSPLLSPSLSEVAYVPESLAEVTTGREAELILAPLLVDLQINGRQGIDFLMPDLTIERIAELAMGLEEDGVGRALATVTTQSFERIAQSVSVIRQAIEQDASTRERLAGIHLEGPYLSPHDGPRGAHPRDQIRPPCLDEFLRWQERAGGSIRLVTLSPEYEGASEFIRQVVARGVLVSLGHLDASRDQILAAVDAGATLSTHLGNGAHAQLRRHPNYLWSQLAEDRLHGMVIADGHHLPDEVLKCFVRCKGAQRTIAVSDMTGLGGMPAGVYPQTALGAVEVLDNGKLVVAGQRDYLAGASLPLWRAIERLARTTDLSLSQAIDACSTHPASILNEATLIDRPVESLKALVLRRERPTTSSGFDSDPGALSLYGIIREGRFRLLG